ncbi:MAG: EAL domain-containing protein [Anaerocolumna sp.]
MLNNYRGKKIIMSIKSSLRITLLVFSIVPILLLSALTYFIISDKLISIKQDNLEQLAQTNSHGLVSLVQNQQTEINLLSIQEQVKELVSSSMIQSLVRTKKYSAGYDEVTNLLHTRYEMYPSSMNITIYNQDKIAISSSDEAMVGKDYSDSVTLYYINATSENANGVSGLIKYKPSNEKSKIYCIEIGCPIFDNSTDQTIIGYIVSTISISHFKDFLNAIVIGDTGFGMVLDKKGEIIFHPNQKLIGTNINNDKLKSLINHYYSGTISKSDSFIYKYESEENAYGYTVIPELDWVLLVKQSVSEIIYLTRIIFYVLIWTVIVLVLFLILISDKIANAYTGPIIELKDAMRTASDGDLDVQSNVKQKNEFGELSRSFNKMLHIIKGNYNELSAIHEELVTNEEELRSNYDRIEYLAYHDVLTQLPNKMAFIDRMNSALSSSPGADTIHAVYFVDLDNFKTINDTLGHDYGDILLNQTATKLQSHINPADILARAGGDEFLIFRENLHVEEEVLEFAQSIIESFKSPFNLNGEILHVSMSIGIALYPKNGFTCQTLIKNADIAMYKSKDTGKSKYTLFDKTMEDELNRSTLILEVLRQAIETGEISIKYQPQVGTTDDKIVGFEALMRIQSKKLGNISPKEFIPIAEESGLIIELGEWILREACRFNKSLEDLGYEDFVVSVNISSVQMKRAGFIDMIQTILAEIDLAPNKLELEITESIIVSSISDVSSLLKDLQDIGVRISLDDFGTGYSSLNYLTNMPINTLKIDKSFIDNISNSKKDSYVADAIIRLAHNIDLEVIAEGVESTDQLKVLRQKKCDMIQGYIFSKPLLPSDLITLLESY